MLGSQLNVSFYFVFVLLKDASESAFALQIFGGLCDGLFGESLDAVDWVSLGADNALDLWKVSFEVVDIWDNLIVGLNVFTVGLDGCWDLFQATCQAFLLIHQRWMFILCNNEISLIY